MPPSASWTCSSRRRAGDIEWRRALRPNALRGWPTAPKIDAHRAGLAARRRAAVRLAHGDEQRVKFLEERGIGRQVSLNERARLLVAGTRADATIAGQDASGVQLGVDHPADSRAEQE